MNFVEGKILTKKPIWPSCAFNDKLNLLFWRRMMTCNTRKENTNVVSATKPSNPLYLSYCLAKRESKLEMEENNFIFKGLPCSIGCQWFPYLFMIWNLLPYLWKSDTHGWIWATRIFHNSGSIQIGLLRGIYWTRSRPPWSI